MECPEISKTEIVEYNNFIAAKLIYVYMFIKHIYVCIYTHETA